MLDTSRMSGRGNGSDDPAQTARDGAPSKAFWHRYNLHHSQSAAVARMHVCFIGSISSIASQLCLSRVRSRPSRQALGEASLADLHNIFTSQCSPFPITFSIN
jgi:hypothetical protein